MSAFSGPFEWQVGLVWQVGFIAGNTLPEKGILHSCKALVDTGASRTCIAKSVADELGLQATGKIDMQTAGGIIPTNIYDVHIVFIFPGKTDSKEMIQQGRGHIVSSTRAPEFDPGDNPYQALLGRDILRLGVLNMSHDGHFSFSY